MSAVVRVQQGTAAEGPVVANHSDGLDVQMAKNPLASTLTHARTARTTLPSQYACTSWV